MSFSKEREKRLEYGYGEVSDIEYLDENMTDEVVSDLEYFSNQSNNDNKIKKLMKRLKCIKVRHNTFMECLYYVHKS